MMGMSITRLDALPSPGKRACRERVRPRNGIGIGHFDTDADPDGNGKAMADMPRANAPGNGDIPLRTRADLFSELPAKGKARPPRGLGGWDS
jgi:hypothetical protein